MIGNLHQSNASIETQEFKTVEVSAQEALFYTTLALRILTTTLREASYMFVHTCGRMTREKEKKIEESREAFIFISGTGLDILIEEYGISYNAEELREEFYKRFNLGYPD